MIIVYPKPYAISLSKGGCVGNGGCCGSDVGGGIRAVLAGASAGAGVSFLWG